MTTRDHSDGGGTCFLSYWKVFKKQINTLLEMHHLKQALNVCMFGFFFFYFGEVDMPLASFFH